MRGIVWFRRDLRLHDHPALTAAAAECEDVLPLFVFDEPLLAAHTFGAACVSFMLGSLEELAERLAKRGSPLQWHRGIPVDVVVRVAREWNADVVYWNRDYEPDTLERDRLVSQQLSESGVTVKTFKDHVVFEADEIRSATGAPLQRYSAYRTRWWAVWHAVKPAALPVPSCLGSPRGSCRPTASLPTARDLGYDPLAPWIEPGEAAEPTDRAAPRPTRPRSWCSWARPKRSACSTTIRLAFGTSTPTSTTVVATRSRRRPPWKSAITASLSGPFMRP